MVGAGWTVTVTLGGTSKWDHAFPAFPEISTEFLIDEQMRTQIFDMKMTPRVSNSLSLPNNTIEFKTPSGEGRDDVYRQISFLSLSCTPGSPQRPGWGSPLFSPPSSKRERGRNCYAIVAVNVCELVDPLNAKKSFFLLMH